MTYPMTYHDENKLLFLNGLFGSGGRNGRISGKITFSKIQIGIYQPLTSRHKEKTMSSQPLFVYPSAIFCYCLTHPVSDKSEPPLPRGDLKPFQPLFVYPSAIFCYCLTHPVSDKSEPPLPRGDLKPFRPLFVYPSAIFCYSLTHPVCLRHPPLPRGDLKPFQPLFVYPTAIFYYCSTHPVIF
jgi:hypothetical protein